MTHFLDAVRRRLRWAWLVATGQLVAPVVALAAFALVMLGRVRPWPWPEHAALLVAVVGAAGLSAAGCLLRIPVPIAARAADRGLRTGDVFATAVELERRPPADIGNPLVERVRSRAADLAARGRAADAVPLPFRPRRLAVVAVLAAGALGLALAANHQDTIRRRRAMEHRVLRVEGERLHRAAEDLRRTADSASQQEVSRLLEELARQVAAAQSLPHARSAVAQAARDLSQRLSPDLLAQKAAVRGLDRTLAATPLPHAGSGDAASQLRQLASTLGQLEPADRAALAERLAALAANQVTGNPDAARALDQAAVALQAGDVATAGTALTEAGAAQVATASAVAGQEAAAEGLAALGATDARLADASFGSPAPGTSPIPGQGQLEGRGQGQPGQGQPGQGQPGQGQTGGSPSGQVQGTNAPTGSGQGGPGSPGGTGNNPSVGLQEATVFEPSGSATSGQQINVQGQIGEGPSQDAGRGDGPSSVHEAQVPLSQVLPRYRAQATQAVSRLGLPPSQRALVQAYFAALAGS